MANKRPKPEEIVTKLRQVEVLTGQGMPAQDSPVPVTAIKRIPFHAFHLLGARAALWWKDRRDIRDRRAKT